MSGRQFVYTVKLLGVIPLKRSVPKPRLYRSKTIEPVMWICSNGASSPGFGRTPQEAWNDWANWGLI